MLITNYNDIRNSISSPSHNRGLYIYIESSFTREDDGATRNRGQLDGMMELSTRVGAKVLNDERRERERKDSGGK